jgi:hypothetical protein
MRLSLRAYARRRGISHTAVQKAVNSGRIDVEEDGNIDPEKADAQWLENTRPSSPSSSPSPIEPYATTCQTAYHTMSTTTDKPPANQEAYLQARATNEVLKAQRQRLKLQAERGELIDRKTVVDQVLRLGRIERDAWLQWPARIASELAAILGIDTHTLHIELEKYVKKHLTQLADIRFVEEELAQPDDSDNANAHASTETDTHNQNSHHDNDDDLAL